MVFRLYTKVAIMQMILVFIILTLLTFIRFLDSNGFGQLAIEYQKIAGFDVNTSLVVKGK